MRLRLMMAVCASFLALTAPDELAEADTITYEFLGSVTQIDLSPGNTASGVYAVGDSVSGTFTIDDAGATDSVPSSEYGAYNGSTTYTLTVGSGTWTGSWSARVTNDRGGNDGFDGFDFLGSATGLFPLPYSSAVAGFGDLSDDTSIWNSDELSELFNLEYGDWPSIAGAIRFETTAPAFAWENVVFELDSLKPVPEPGSLALMVLGLVGIAGATRRYRRAR